MSKVIELDKAIIQKLDENIICLEFKDVQHFELEDAIQVDLVYEELSERKPYFSLVDTRKAFGIISRDAREHFAKNEILQGLRLAEALIVKNMAQRILATGYLSLNKPKNPGKIFQDYDEALQWLKSHVMNKK